MKNRYCAVLISCASVLAANAATIIAELPESANLSQTATMAPQTGNQLLDKVKGREFGVYAGGNNNSLANWPQNGEGTWVNHDDVGSIILCGRSGVAGDSFAMVLGGPRQGELVSSIIFSCDTPTSVITSYTMVLAVYDSAGTLVRNLPPWKALPLIPLQERRPFPWTWRILPWRGGKDTSWLPECAAARAAPPPPIRLPTSKYPMKPFRNRLPHLWECLAWEPSSSGVPGTGERYTFQSGRRRPEKRLFSFFRSEKARFGMA